MMTKQYILAILELCEANIGRSSSVLCNCIDEVFRGRLPRYVHIVIL